MEQKFTDEQKREFEINKMFDLSEKVLMEYVCYYMDKRPEELFEQSIDKITSGEFVIQSLEDGKKETLHFSLEMVPANFENKIPKELLDNPFIRDIIKFIEHSIKEVFNSIVLNIKKECVAEFMNRSFHLELDPVSLSFKPIYVYPVKRQLKIAIGGEAQIKQFYESNKHLLNTDAENQLNKKIRELRYVIDKNKFDENEAEKKEKEINDYIKDIYRIGIIFKIKQ